MDAAVEVTRSMNMNNMNKRGGSEKEEIKSETVAVETNKTSTSFLSTLAIWQFFILLIIAFLIGRLSVQDLSDFIEKITY